MIKFKRNNDRQVHSKVIKKQKKNDVKSKAGKKGRKLTNKKNY